MYGRAMSPPEEGHQRHIVQHVNALRTLGTPMVSPSPSCGNPPNGTSDVAICPAAMSKNSRVGRPLQHRRTSRVRFAPYPYPDLPPIPSTTGDLLGMILREDMSLDAKEDKAEAAQSWLLQSTKRYGTPTAGYSPPSPMEENLDLSSSQSTPRPIIPTHTPFLTPPTTPSSALTDIEGFSEDEAEVLAEIKENVHSLISPKSARIGLSYLPPTPPHTPESTRSRPLPAHVPNRPNFRTPRSPSFTVEEDCFYGRGPPARWLLPDLAATREGKSGPQTTRQQTINQPPCVAAAPLLALDRSDIAPIGLAMRKGDYRSLARRIKTTSNECQDLTAVSIMPHSPKKQVKRLQGAKMYQEDGKCRQFKHLLAQQDHLSPCHMVAHARYSNIASSDRSIYLAAKASLELEMERVKKLGIQILVFHLGGDDTCHSRNDKLRIANLISQLLNNTADVTLAIETTSRCRGSHNSTTLAGLSELIRMVDMPGRIKVCIDLCHISQQYDFCDHKGRVAFLNDVEELGFRNVAAIHASNNYYERGQGKSRHACFTNGVIPLEAFRDILRDVRLRHVPVILECPAYFPGYEARGIRVAADGRPYRGKAAKLDRLEQSRRQGELRFLTSILKYPDPEWATQQHRLISDWHEAKQLIEKQIYKVIHEMAPETVVKFEHQQRRINKDIRHAASFRRNLPDVFGYPVKTKIEAERRSADSFRRIYMDHSSPNASRGEARKRRKQGFDIDVYSV